MASCVRYRRLGSSDLEVSEISLGSWLTYGAGVRGEQAEACVAKAFDVGINFIDTANVYGRGRAEEFLGKALEGRQRDSYVLATKLYFPMNGDRGLSREPRASVPSPMSPPNFVASITRSRRPSSTSPRNDSLPPLPP